MTNSLGTFSKDNAPVEETINFSQNLKKKIDQQIKKYGTKANDLLESIEFILNRKF